ncbi:MAG: hypothetical protein ACF8SC_00140 [Phycisphaerales bacterium JB037]
MLDRLLGELAMTGLLAIPFAAAITVPMSILSRLRKVRGACDWCGHRSEPGELVCAGCGRAVGAVRRTGLWMLLGVAGGFWVVAAMLLIEPIAHAVGMSTAIVSIPLLRLGPLSLVLLPLTGAIVTMLPIAGAASWIAHRQTNHRPALFRGYFLLVLIAAIGGLVMTRLWFGATLDAMAGS